MVYFAAARDLTLVGREEMSLNDGATVGDLAAEISRRHRPLEKFKDSVRYSLNLEVVDESSTLSDGDEVGVLPPVAGG